jgi:hypothetical protein
MDYSKLADWRINTLAANAGLTVSEWKAQQDRENAGKQNGSKSETPVFGPPKPPAGGSRSGSTSSVSPDFFEPVYVKFRENEYPSVYSMKDANKAAKQAGMNVDDWASTYGFEFKEQSLAGASPSTMESSDAQRKITQRTLDIATGRFELDPEAQQRISEIGVRSMYVPKNPLLEKAEKYRGVQAENYGPALQTEFDEAEGTMVETTTGEKVYYPMLPDFTQSPEDLAALYGEEAYTPIQTRDGVYMQPKFKYFKKDSREKRDYRDIFGTVDDWRVITNRARVDDKWGGYISEEALVDQLNLELAKIGLRAYETDAISTQDFSDRLGDLAQIVAGGGTPEYANAITIAPIGVDPDYVEEFHLAGTMPRGQEKRIFEAASRRGWGPEEMERYKEVLSNTKMAISDPKFAEKLRDIIYFYGDENYLEKSHQRFLPIMDAFRNNVKINIPEISWEEAKEKVKQDLLEETKQFSFVKEAARGVTDIEDAVSPSYRLANEIAISKESPEVVVEKFLATEEGKEYITTTAEVARDLQIQEGIDKAFSDATKASADIYEELSENDRLTLSALIDYETKNINDPRKQKVAEDAKKALDQDRKKVEESVELAMKSGDKIDYFDAMLKISELADKEKAYSPILQKYTEDQISLEILNSETRSWTQNYDYLDMLSDRFQTEAGLGTQYVHGKGMSMIYGALFKSDYDETYEEMMQREKDASDPFYEEKYGKPRPAKPTYYEKKAALYEENLIASTVRSHYAITSAEQRRSKIKEAAIEDAFDSWGDFGPHRLL